MQCSAVDRTVKYADRAVSHSCDVHLRAGPDVGAAQVAEDCHVPVTHGVLPYVIHRRDILHIPASIYAESMAALCSDPERSSISLDSNAMASHLETVDKQVGMRRTPLQRPKSHD